MLLIKGFLEDASAFSSEKSFKSFYLTLSYKSNFNDSYKNMGLKSEVKKTKFIGGKDAYDTKDLALINEKKLSLNVIKNIRDISGYEDEKSSELVQTQVENSNYAKEELNLLENITRIEVAPSGEFVIQVPKKLNPSESVSLKVYSPHGEFTKEFSYLMEDLKNLAEAKKDLRLKIEAKSRTFTRRQFQTKEQKVRKLSGSINSIEAGAIPEGLKLVLWGSNKQLKRFNDSDMKVLAVAFTAKDGAFEFEYSEHEPLKTAYLSVSADEILAKKLEILADGHLPESMSLMFRSIKYSKFIDSNSSKSYQSTMSEIFFYRVIRTSQFGYEDQMNSSNFIKPLSCFDQNYQSEMKQVALGHVLVLKQSWTAKQACKLDGDYQRKLVESVFDEKFSQYYLGGLGFALNLGSIKANDKYATELLGSAYSYIEEELKSKLFLLKSQKSCSFVDIEVEQSLFDVRAVLFVPYEMKKFDMAEVLMYKSLLQNNLLESSYEPLLANMKAFSEDNVDLDIDNFLFHVNQNLSYYHRLIWYKMDSNRRFEILDNCISPNTNGRSIASIVENKVLGILGNSIILPLAAGYNYNAGSKDEVNESLIELYKKTSLTSTFNLKLPMEA